MKITFLGTGADDWDWTAMRPGTRGSTATLFGSTLLLDAGPTVSRALAPVRASAARVADILVTHSHGDHFNPESVAAIARAGRRRLRVWASPQVLARLDPGLPCEKRPVLPGYEFAAAGFRILALPANHATRLDGEQPLHYLLRGRGVRLLYALDGAWMRSDAHRLLKAALGGMPLTAVVWDATCGGTLNDWRFADHNDLAMIDAMRAAMRKDGLCDDATVHVFDHVARTLWPRTPAAQRRLAARHGGHLAEDGAVLSLPAR